MTNKDRYLVRNTASKKGRNLCITPENSDLKFLSCGRIILDQDVSQVEIEARGNEVSLICIEGSGTVETDSDKYAMQPYDALYLPPESAYRVSTETEFDLAESLAPSEKASSPQFVGFKSIQDDSELHLKAGKDTYYRDVYKLIDENVEASRLLCGLTFGRAGNWTSWSPHQHGASKEEVYLYINMPAPSFGIQMLYDSLDDVDFISPVFEDDAVIITHGFHPNTGIPGYGINFVWMMSALRPEVDRDWTDMHFEEIFAGKY